MSASRPIRHGFATALSALFTIGLSGQALAQSVTTTPVGAMVYSFPATTSSTISYISIPLTNPSIYSGSVQSSTANTITFSGTPFEVGALSQSGSPFFARVATGNQAGRIMLITGNTSNSLTVDTTDNSAQNTTLDTSGWALAAGNRIEVIVGDTLASLFGDNTSNNPLLFVGDIGSLAADTVSVYNKSTGKFDAYFFNTSAGYWRPVSVNQNKNSLVLYPEASIMIVRKADRGAVSLTLVGDVPVTAPLIKVTGNNGIVYTGTRYPVDITLSQLNLPNWVRSDSSLSADSLLVYNSVTGKSETFFRRLDNGQWNRAGGGTADRSSLILGAGSSLGILKRGIVSGASSMLYQPIPYSL